MRGRLEVEGSQLGFCRVCLKWDTVSIVSDIQVSREAIEGNLVGPQQTVQSTIIMKTATASLHASYGPVIAAQERLREPGELSVDATRI